MSIICPSGQGRACPRPTDCQTADGCHFQAAMNAPINQRNSDGTHNPHEQIELYESPWDCVVDMLKTGVYLAGSVALGIALAIAVAWFTGLGGWLIGG